jgi:hypothetical protein
MKNQITVALLLSTILVLAAACATKSADPSKATNSVDTGKAINSTPAGNLTVTLSSASGQLKHGGDDFFLTFKDSSGKPVDAGSVGLVFHMPGMGTMREMNDQATLTTTDAPGIYSGKANIEMSGEWQARIRYEGPAGKGQTALAVNVQ